MAPSAWNWPLTVLCGLALGAAIGLWQGYWVPVFAFLTGGLIQSAVGNANQNGSGL